MSEVYWRDSQRSARFFMFDAKASFAIIVFLFHMRLWTLIFALVVMLVFWALERKGLNFITSLRVLRMFLIGKNRPRASRLEKITMKDFG